MSRSKQGIESIISRAMARFFKEQIGERPEAVITQVVGNTIIVRLKNVAPPAERHLIRDKERGGKLIEEIEAKLTERVKPLLEVMIRNLTGAEVVDLYSSFNAKTGERIEIFRLNKDLEKTRQT